MRKNPTESRKDWLMQQFEEAGQNHSHNKQYQLWQQHSHPIELDTNEMINTNLPTCTTIP